MTLPPVPQFEAQGLTDYLIDLSRAIQIGQQNRPVQTRLQPYNGNLQAFSDLVGAADKLPYFTGPEALALIDLTAAGRALIDDANAAAQLTTLGVSAYIKTLLDDADAIAARTTLGVGYELIGTVQIPSNVASIIWTGLSPYHRIRLSGSLAPATSGVSLLLQYSEDNGATFKAGATDYYYVYQLGSHTGAAVIGDASNSSWVLNGAIMANTAGLNGGKFIVEIDEWNKASRAKGLAHIFSLGTVTHYVGTQGLDATRSVARDALKISFTSGNIASGIATLEGIRG